MRRRVVAPLCRVMRGATSAHRRLRRSIVVTAAGLAAWLVWRMWF